MFTHGKYKKAKQKNRSKVKKTTHVKITAWGAIQLHHKAITKSHACKTHRKKQNFLRNHTHCPNKMEMNGDLEPLKHSKEESMISTEMRVLNQVMTFP